MSNCLAEINDPSILVSDADEFDREPSEKSIELNPRCANYYAQRANIHARQEKYDDAIMA